MSTGSRTRRLGKLRTFYAVARPGRPLQSTRDYSNPFGPLVNVASWKHRKAARTQTIDNHQPVPYRTRIHAMAPSTSSSLFHFLTPIIQSFRNASISRSSLPSTTSLRSPLSKYFSTSPQLLARGRKGKQNAKDPRISLIRYHLRHAQNPRPLRLSRMRALRHWTIHRAWMLNRRKRLEQEELELQRYVNLRF